MLQDSIQAIENAENSTLIWLAVLLGMVIGWQVLKLGGQTLTGFFRNDKAQHSFISDLLNENAETREALVNTNNELLQTNRELSETNKQTVEELKGTTAALAELAREIRGVRSTTDEHYALGKIIHEKTEATNTLISDNTRDIMTKLDVLIGAINTQSRHSRNNDRLIREIRQTQWWLHLRLQTQFPQLALPAPQDNGTIAVA